MIQYRDQAIAVKIQKIDIGIDRERKAALDTHVHARAAAAAVGYDGVAHEY